MLIAYYYHPSSHDLYYQPKLVLLSVMSIYGCVCLWSTVAHSGQPSSGTIPTCSIPTVPIPTCVIHDGSLCTMLMSSLAKRAIKHNRLVCIGGVKLSRLGLGRVSLDAIIHAAITPTGKGRLELSSRTSQFRAFVTMQTSAEGARIEAPRAPSLPREGVESGDGSCICASDWHQDRWPWMILNSISLNFQRMDFADFGRNNSKRSEDRPIVSDSVVSTSNWSNFWHAFVSRGFVSDSWAFLSPV